MGALLTLLPQILSIVASVASNAPGIIADIENAWTIATADTPPTPDQQTAYDAALDAAHKTLQDS